MDWKEREKLPEAPVVVVLVMPVGVCSATTVAPDTFTVPLIPEVVSTSAKVGKLRQKTEEKRRNDFLIDFNPEKIKFLVHKLPKFCATVQPILTVNPNLRA